MKRNVPALGTQQLTCQHRTDHLLNLLEFVVAPAFGGVAHR